MLAVEAVAARDRRLWPFNGFAHSGRHAEAPDDGGYLATDTVHPVCSSPRADGGADRGAAQQLQQQQELQHEQQQQMQVQAAALPPCKKHKADAGAADAPHAGSNGSTQPAPIDTPTAPQAASSNGSNGNVDGVAATTAATEAAAAAAAQVVDDCGSTDWSRKPYLCTGYDCFVVQEPCIMCSMALVHSRLARVVYCRGDAQHGALGGRLRLHAQRSLNHHYLVYHMPGKGEQLQEGQQQ